MLYFCGKIHVMKKYFLIFIIHFLILSFLHSQVKNLRIAFYNVENLFDYFDDSTKNDDAFTPRGVYHWKKERYETKLNHLYKTIVAMDSPAILGMCEVENDKVLLDLIKGTPLRQFNYDFVHFESADSRGIDVAMIYRKDIVQLDTAYPIKFIVPPDTVSKTRDFLYAKMRIKPVIPAQAENLNIHIIVCHFPSKYGGLMATKQLRFMAGQLLRKTVESIFAEDSNANIITMGDFNDEATDESIVEGFGAICASKGLQSYSKSLQMFNLMCGLKTDVGTHKYQDTWSIIDQIMVSQNLYLGENKLTANKANIFTADFLLVDDAKYLGKKTNRTYIGFKYNGGYSDHLPVYVDMGIDF
jgi:predicted extracellular nuclease